MKRNVLYLLIGALVVVVAVLGYIVYEDQQSSSSVEITVGDDGVSIEAD